MSVFTILERLAPHIEEEVNLIINSKQEAETLKSKLEKLQEGLQDAERQAVTDLNVKRWLKELEDVMYKMDDALDKWETKNLELQIEQSEYDDISDRWEKVRSLFLFLCLSFKHVVGRREVTLEMKALSERLDNILEERGKYNFVSNKSDRSRELEKPETTSPVDKSKVYIGRESEIDELVKLLLSKGEEDGGSQVVSIVGVGGLGKTTLAQLVYNDPRIEQHFGELRAWVSVPDPFDSSHVARAIAESFDGKSSSDNSTLQNLGQRIKAAVLLKQNFLVVLDDVWTVDEAKWLPLKNFLVDEPGCRILVTTRDQAAAETMGTTHSRHLKSLLDSDCATILNTIALKGRASEEQYEGFHEIGFEIAGKCNGLPLAAKTIGHMLRSRFNLQEWRDVRESPLWKYEDEMSDIFRALRLSYMDLSPILKRCFLTCALYSKGSWIRADELIRIWMAQGYISASATWDEVHSKGMQFFHKLFARSFFQELAEEEGNMRCKMHDVMHEFAIYMSRSECYIFVDGGNLNMPSIERARNFCARSSSSGCLKNLPPNLLCLLKCVRVLCLSNCDLKEVFQEIGKLIHLRYLDLSKNPIQELPETMCDLLNLQTLNLEGCSLLTKLPHGIGKLMKLRHLLISCTNFTVFPPGFRKLTGLWTLRYFIATSDSVEYLRDFNQLRGSLEIRVKHLNEASEAKKANLREKNHIEKLDLFFCGDVTVDVAEALVPPPQLQTLFISAWPRNLQLPSWITTASLNNLKTLRIYGFDDCSYNWPPLGRLPMLETLCLFNMSFKSIKLSFLGIIPNGTSDVVGGFPKLKLLEFDGCYLWEEWEDLEEEAAAAVDSDVQMNIMPCLEELEISFSRKLKALPHGLLLHGAKTLRKLKIVHADCLESRYHKEFGVDREKISHIPFIAILGNKTKKMDNAVRQLQ